MHNNTRHAPRERVSWNNSVRHFTANFLQSRSTWACELKLYTIFSFLILNGSRSTWACELKFNLHFCKWHLHLVTLHVSVWVEIQNLFAHINNVFVTLHVSVWVEIATRFSNCCTLYVTLHVSVWVEIYPRKWHENGAFVTLHVSVWVEMDVLRWRVAYDQVTLHVSVWVEIIHSANLGKSARSRSTWACELKLFYKALHFGRVGHAPRERVSWNTPFGRVSLRTTASRSTWACELKYTNSVLALCVYPSRSTWACELKFCHECIDPYWQIVTLHVSVWVEIGCNVATTKMLFVTLHVSVWVEIVYLVNTIFVILSRSTWACELKY